MIHSRIHQRLEDEQCDDQCGFRPGIRIEDAIGTAEILISAAHEYGLELWMANLELKKAFGRVEHHALFSALRDQGLCNDELALLLDLYTDQTGSANGSRSFDIMRGVKQGDTLSSLLFNAVIEHVFRRWKLRLAGEGWLINHHHD